VAKRQPRSKADDRPAPPDDQSPFSEEVGQLSHEEAAALEHYCPICRTISYDPEPQVYQCKTCSQEGYTCCVASALSECPRCRAKREREAQKAAAGA
jgi:hypothetical protein